MQRKYVLFAVTLFDVFLCIRFLNPDAIPGFCIFRALTGIPCMFCGLTHAFHAILHGQWQAAIGFHPLAYLAFGLMIFHFILFLQHGLGWQKPHLLPGFNVQEMMLVTFSLFTVAWVVGLLV